MTQLSRLILFVITISIIIPLVLFLKSAEFILTTNGHSPEIYLMTNESVDNYTRCIFAMEQALHSLSIPWFLNYGTALMYWRSNNFVSDDMDIGVFYKDFLQQNYTEQYFLSIMENQFYFKLSHSYGQLDHGKEWTFTCPNSEIHIDIFVFYPFKKTANLSFTYWTASYNGLCRDMIYGKCRWGFSDFNVTAFEMYGKLLHTVPLEFIIERYGNDYMTPKQYGYFESLKFLPNLIPEYKKRTKTNISHSKSSPKYRRKR